MLATSELQYKLCLKIISEARLARSAQRLLQLWMTVIYGQNIRDWKEILLSFTQRSSSLFSQASTTYPFLL